jgi:hypothetical protein
MIRLHSKATKKEKLRKESLVELREITREGKDKAEVYLQYLINPDISGLSIIILSHFLPWGLAKTPCLLTKLEHWQATRQRSSMYDLGPMRSTGYATLSRRPT